MAPKDADLAPRRALATSRGSGPKHHQHRSHDRPPETLSRTRDDATPATPLGRTRARASSPPHEGPRALSPRDDHPLKSHKRPGEGTTPNKRRGQVRSQESGSRTPHVPFKPSGRDEGSGKWAGGGGEGEARRARAGSAWREPVRGRARQRRRELGHQVNVHGIPPPPARERSRDAQDASRPQHPWRASPRTGPPQRWGPTPREPPAAGGPIGTSIRPVRPRQSRPRGKRPQARAARPVSSNTAASGDSGRERAGRQPLARHGEAGRAGAPPKPLGRHTHPRGSSRARARNTHAGEPHTRAGRRPGPAGSSPDSEGGGAGRGRQRAALGPTAGPAVRSLLRKRGSSAQRASGSHPASVATTRAEEGRRLGGSGTPRHPLGSLEKAFSPRVHRPQPNSFPTPTGPPQNGVPEATRAQGEQGWVCGKGQAQGHPERSRPGPHEETAFAPPRTPCSRHRPRQELRNLRRGNEKTETGTACCWAKKAAALGWPSATALARPAATAHTPRQVQPPPRHQLARGRGRRGARAPPGGRGGPPLPTPPPAPRARHRQQWPEGRGRWERETTPPARSQAPETTWSAPGAPRRARRNAHSAHAQAGEQRGVGTAPPAAGRTAHHTRSHGRQARVSAASEDPGPASAAKQNAGRRGRAGACTSSPPHPRHTATAGGGEGARGPAGRTRRAIPFAMNVRPSSGAA